MKIAVDWSKAMTYLKILTGFALAGVLTHINAFGADPATPASNAVSNVEDAARAKALLELAVADFEGKKDAALADFVPGGLYIDGELYVYVLSSSGKMLASGGPSSALVGRDVADQPDALGKMFFREMIAKARTHDSGSVEYIWLNPVDNKVERKVAYFRKVDDRIIAVGYYLARATPAQAQALLQRAVDAVHTDRDKALTAFNRTRGAYSEDDLYVFAIDLKANRFVAHGMNRSLVGTDALALRDASGNSLGRDLTSAVRAVDRAELDYRWPNPVTGEVENKHTYLRKIDGLLVGVGYYAR